jgi:WD40 repeat protein
MGRLQRWVNALAYSPDGRTLAAGTGQVEGKREVAGFVDFMDPQTAQVRATLRVHEATIQDLAFAPDGRSLATASRDGTVKLLDGGRPAR